LDNLSTVFPFLKTIESSLLTQGYNVHYLDATALSSSGIIEYMFTNDVYCLLDELDKLEKEHQSVFLNLLETVIQFRKNILSNPDGPVNY
jgi:hypothetical protein